MKNSKASRGKKIKSKPAKKLLARKGRGAAAFASSDFCDSRPWWAQQLEADTRWEEDWGDH